jgi:uncharacterized protein YdaU (DUF1376 family)
LSDKIRRVDFHPDEYISGVAGTLRADEQGVYWMVCALIYSHGKPIANDAKRIAGLTSIRPSDARRILDKLVTMGKLTVDNEGKLSQKRTQSEIELSANRIQSAFINGSKGGRPSRKYQYLQQIEKAAGLSSGNLTTNQEPRTNIGLNGIGKDEVDGIALNRKSDAALFEACNLILTTPLAPSVTNHRFPKDIVDLAWATLKETEK